MVPPLWRDRSKRICPGCGEVKECNLATGGDQWYTRKRLRAEVAGEGIVEYSVDIIASPYCRDCTSRRNVESRRRRRLVERLAVVRGSAQAPDLPTVAWPGLCEICREEIDYVVVVDSPRVGLCCWRCSTLISEDIERLAAMLRLLLTHNTRERDLDEKPSQVIGKPSRSHKHRFGRIQNHEECVALEERVRDVLLWIFATSAR